MGCLCLDSRASGSALKLHLYMFRQVVPEAHAHCARVGAANCAFKVPISKRPKDGRAGIVDTLLRGSWDLVTRVMIRVNILIATYNPN